MSAARRVRDAVNGRFRSRADAETDPERTVVERISPTPIERVRTGLPSAAAVLVENGVDLDVEVLAAALHAYEEAQ